jgi:hypothetical protein
MQFDSAGLIISIQPGAVPINFNAGTPTGVLGSLQVATIGSTPFAGLFYDDVGHINVANGGVIAGHAPGGMPVDATGKLCVDYDIPVSFWHAGLPYTAAGRLALRAPVVPVNFFAYANAFSTAFDTEAALP